MVDAVTPRALSRSGPCTRTSGGAELDAGLCGEGQEGQRFLEVELDVVGVVGQVADRQVLAQMQLVVTAAGGQEQGIVYGGRPDDLAVVQEPGEVVADRVAVVGGLGNCGVEVGRQQQVVRPVDTGEP